MPENDSWENLPWFDLEADLFRLQKRIYRASLRSDFPSIRSLQRLLLACESARLIAVRRVTQDNMGKRTPGVDGIASIEPERRLELARRLHVTGEAAPVRRVYIPKPGTEELRPLGIPTIHDRALQTLVRFALEPEWEARFEPNSYGFRPGRSCWDATEAIYAAISQKAKYVLDADIAKCFDRIDHEALLHKVSAGPAIARQLRAWLKAGILDGAELFPPAAGTPQGGAISPLLANIALHGLEELVQRRFGRRMHNRVRLNAAALVRYADDLVVLHEMEEVVRESQGAIAEWLRGMGLELKPSKTRIGHTLLEVGGQAGFDFLGFTVRQFPAGKTRTRRNGQGQPLGFVTLIKPSKKAIRRHVDRMRELIADHDTAPQATLICHLSPVIRGWANYYSTEVSKKVFHTLDHVLTKMLIAWACRRHPHKPRKWVVRKYWDIVKGRNWTFRCRQREFRLRRHGDTKIVRHVKVRDSRSPYDGDWVYWSSRLGRYPDVFPVVAKLLKRQKGKCAWCGLYFRHDDQWNVDHIVRKSEGGKDTDSNLQLLHSHCHKTKTRKDRGRGLIDSHQTTEEPCEGKLSSTVLEPSGVSDHIA
jgi:RNA-directed DNA polymerase